MKLKVLKCVLDLKEYKCLDEEKFDGVELKMITEINEEYEIKLQRALYLFNSEFNKENRIEYHGMWDIDEAKWRLNNDNFQFWVVEYKDDIIGWGWNILDKVSIYFNNTGGLIYNPRKKEELRKVTDIYIHKNEIYGLNLYLESKYRGNTFSKWFKSERPRRLYAMGYKKLMWHTEGWNKSAISLLGNTVGIEVETQVLFIDD